jgi:heat shock protein HslJ
MYVSAMHISRNIRRLVVVGLVAGTAVGFTACGSDDDGSGDTTASTDLATEGTVEGVTWTVTELDGEAPPAGVTATLLFDGTNVSGSSGCNNYSGGATFDEDVVEISDGLAGTMMACEAPISEFEAAYLAMLADASVFAVTADTLTLSNDSDEVLATFTAG